VRIAALNMFQVHPDRWFLTVGQAQSRRHGRVLVGLFPPNKAPRPPKWNMKHHKLVWIFVKSECQAPLLTTFWRRFWSSLPRSASFLRGSEPFAELERIPSNLLFETKNNYVREVREKKGYKTTDLGKLWSNLCYCYEKALPSLLPLFWKGRGITPFSGTPTC